MAVKSPGCDAISRRVRRLACRWRRTTLPPAMPAPAMREAEHRPPMVAPAVAVDLRRAAEFADRHDQRFIEQAALVQVFDQGRKADVELRAQHIFQPVGVLGVRIPQRIIDGVVARLARPLHMHQPHARLDQPPGQQHALPPAVAAVALANFVRLFAEWRTLRGPCPR